MGDACTCGGKMWCEACQDAAYPPPPPPSAGTAGPRTRALLAASDIIGHLAGAERRAALERIASGARRSGKTAAWEAVLALELVEHHDACQRAVDRRGLTGLGFGLAAIHGAPASPWSP